MGLKTMLYPPIVETWSPTVAEGDLIKIPFALSVYNTLEEVRTDCIIVDIRNTKTNLSIVNIKRNDNSMQLTCKLQIDEKTGGYYIEISNNLVILNAGETYKVQLRFCSSECSEENIKKIKKNISNYGDFLSEYSGITLLKIISVPILKIAGFPAINVKNEYVISTPTLEINGKIEFKSKNIVDYLSTYRIWLYESDNNIFSENDTLLVDTGVLYSNTKELNTFKYIVKHILSKNKHYLLRIQYTMSEGYTGTRDIHFIFDYEAAISCSPPLVTAEMDKEDGSVKVKIYPLQETIEAMKNDGVMINKPAYVVLCRSSSIDNFNTIEDLRFFKFSDIESAGIVVTDYLVQSGVFYRYYLMPITRQGYRTVWTVSSGGTPMPADNPIA